eukprot:scaffold3914_cov84-Amphora_coffeaeformis.AAC.1
MMNETTVNGSVTLKRNYHPCTSLFHQRIAYTVAYCLLIGFSSVSSVYSSSSVSSFSSPISVGSSSSVWRGSLAFFAAGDKLMAPPPRHV